MSTHISSIIPIVGGLFITAGCGPPTMSFGEDIKPILTANCLKCHDDGGEGFSASGFSVQTYDSIMKGTKYGPVIEPGSSIASTLYLMVSHKVDKKIQMPPHHSNALAKGRENQLTETQIESIQKWIDQGAMNN